MRLNDFKIGWRILISEPAYLAIVTFGMALGFAACFLLLGYVNYSFSYDHQVPDLDRVYTVKQRINVFSAQSLVVDALPMPFIDVAKNSGLAEDVGMVHGMEGVAVGNGRPVGMEIDVVDSGFVQIFGLHALEGDLGSVLKNPDAIALTVSTAAKLFGHAHVLGLTLTIDGKAFLVAAVLADAPDNTNQPYGLLVGPQSSAWSVEQRNQARNDWGDGACRIFLKLKPGTSAHALQEAMQNVSDQYNFGDPISPEMRSKLGGKKPRDVELIALSDRYFDVDLRNGGASGDRQVVMGLAAVAVMILVLAATNYVNLNIVRTIRRRREIGLRKLLGARAAHLMSLFMAESFIVTFVAAMLGMLMIWLVLPLFSSLMMRNLSAQFNGAAFAVALAIGFLVACLTGLYPAWVAFKVIAARALQGRDNQETASGFGLRRILTVVQYTLAIGFTGVTLSIAWQIYFSSHVSPGFDTNHLFVLTMPIDLSDPKGVAFEDAVKRVPGVVDVASSTNPPGMSNHKIGFEMKDKAGQIVSISAQNVSPNFFDLIQVNATAGRLFEAGHDHADDEHLVVLNSFGARTLGFVNPEAAIGQTISYHQKSWEVIGIAPEIRHQSMREAMAPTVYKLASRNNVLTIRTNLERSQLESTLSGLWERAFPAFPFELLSAQDSIAQTYADDVRLAKLLTAASVLAILIAAFGIYVLSAYTVQRRYREITLRKLYGASGSAIGRLLAREFGELIGVSTLLGLLVAYVASSRYLAQFVEHAPMGLSPLFIGSLLTMLIALLTVWRHVRTAMNVSPSAALR